MKALLHSTLSAGVAKYYIQIDKCASDGTGITTIANPMLMPSSR
jgi:hypothetical protein